MSIAGQTWWHNVTDGLGSVSSEDHGTHAQEALIGLQSFSSCKAV